MNQFALLSKLTAPEREDLLADVLPYAQSVLLPACWPELPPCCDPNDQMFLALAHSAHADALVSGDDDLLSMQGQVPFPVLSAQGLAELLGPAYNAS